MIVTSVKVNLAKKEGTVMAFVSVCFDDQFVVHDLRVLKTRSGLVVSMPNKKIGDSFKDSAHPITTSFREYLSSEVMKAYIEEASKAPEASQADSSES